MVPTHLRSKAVLSSSLLLHRVLTETWRHKTSQSRKKETTSLWHSGRYNHQWQLPVLTNQNPQQFGQNVHNDDAQHWNHCNTRCSCTRYRNHKGKNPKSEHFRNSSWQNHRCPYSVVLFGMPNMQLSNKSVVRSHYMWIMQEQHISGIVFGQTISQSKLQIERRKRLHPFHFVCWTSQAPYRGLWHQMSRWEGVAIPSLKHHQKLEYASYGLQNKLRTNSKMFMVCPLFQMPGKKLWVSWKNSLSSMSNMMLNSSVFWFTYVVMTMKSI